MATVFISYSWDSAEHKAWVRRLGEDLRARGITVWLDQFDLRLGDDITQFMERGVSDADCVLLVCTDTFGQKANDRRGGVGYEQAVVTSEFLHSTPPRGRFVCILRQGTPSQALPIYMKHRVWLDCRDDSTYSVAIEQIVEHVLRDHEPDASAISASLAAEPSRSTTPAPSIAPNPWVLVAGTGATRGFSAELETLSRKLGERLMLAHCGLITGGWKGVDEWVARSFADTASKRGFPLEDALLQVIVRTDIPAFTAGQLIFVSKGREEWDEPIRRADIVVLLGGLGGTKETGKRALKMKKPVLPIADSGGDAKEIYVEMLRDWPSLAWMDIPEGDFRRLGRQASSAVEVAAELVQRAGGAA